VLKRAFSEVMAKTQPSDLQYAGAEAHPELIEALLPRLAADGVPAESDDLVTMSSTRQVLALTLRVAPTIVESRELIVAVEEPGHYSLFDTIEGLGHRLIGVDVDDEGVVPSSLAAALDRGANVVLVTPRAQNPTGVSWTAARRSALADVLASAPRTVIVEDDHLAGVAMPGPGSFLSDPRLEERTVYVRSFSKSVGPDLRMTVVAARPRLRSLLRDSKLVTDGWSPRLMQRVLATTLQDPALDVAFEVARSAYAERRQAATEAINALLHGSVTTATDGINLWVQLPPGCETLDVMHNAAELGVLVSSGEAFYVRPGHTHAVRMSVSWVEAEEARLAGELLAQAALTVDEVPVSIVV
jgi:GntR family transcriptional regulator/MocR family aminotransferase